VSIASLRGRALLLSGAAALWSGDLDAARDGLLSAWRSFGEGRLSEPHLARVETFEALRRISEGHPAEAAALAGRAEETFAISGHEVDAARATLGAGLAAWGAGRHREGASLLRKSALGFRRAAAWSSFVTASCAAALCLAAHGQIEDSRRAFRDLRRRKAQEAPLADRMFVRETERIALLSERKPSKGKKTAAPFSAADAILLRGASVLGENLVASARKGDEELEISLSELQTIPYRAFVFLYACQKGNALVVQDPLRALKLGRSFLEEEESLRDAKSGGALAAAVLGETVMAEGELLKSASLVQLGYARESRRAAVDARELFLAGGDVRLGMALAEYYEGQAAGFERDYVAGEQLLKKALKIFADLGQDHFMGRAEAAIGTLLKQRGEEVRALPYLERGIEMLDPAEDSRPLSSTLNNLGGAVARLGRFDEAEVYFARALAAARRLNSEAHCHVIRNALAELELQRGRYGRALRAFLQLAGVARAAGWKMEQLFAELYVAECLGRLGREEEMAEAITVLRTEHRANPFTPSPAMGELFACLDQGILDSNLVAHVRAYLEDEAKGIRRPYLRLDVVG
jgi:tetratricopeptide (TPR) repeat protein